MDRVIVVDDGSSDATASLAEAAGALVLRHKLNRGQGASLETGHEYARSINADYVLHFDADSQFSVDDIAPALTKLKQKNADILFGSRFLDQRSDIPWFKRYILLPFGRVFNWLWGAPLLSDAHNGFRLLNKRALHAIHLTQDRMAHATEIPVQVKQYGLSYIEFPVQVMYREYGQGLKGAGKIVYDLFIHKGIK